MGLTPPAEVPLLGGSRSQGPSPANRHGLGISQPGRMMASQRPSQVSWRRGCQTMAPMDLRRGSLTEGESHTLPSLAYGSFSPSSQLMGFPIFASDGAGGATACRGALRTLSAERSNLSTAINLVCDRLVVSQSGGNVHPNSSNGALLCRVHGLEATSSRLGFLYASPLIPRRVLDQAWLSLPRMCQRSVTWQALKT
jgi:hypothetical protein